METHEMRTVSNWRLGAWVGISYGIPGLAFWHFLTEARQYAAAALNVGGTWLELAAIMSLFLPAFVLSRLLIPTFGLK